MPKANTQSSFIYTKCIIELVLPIIKKHLTRIISSKETNHNVVSALSSLYIKDIEKDIFKVLQNEDMNKRLDNITHKLDKFLEMKEGMNES